MKRTIILGFLVVANLALAGRLVLRLTVSNHPVERETLAARPASPPVPAVEPAPERSIPPPALAVPTTPFADMYSQDSRLFVANLRAVRCPEATVRDIMIAEIGLRFRAREEALRPTPADHVPFAWSANTSEAKLLERRQQAATLAREKAVLLREALGYEVPVGMHTYAMTVSEQQFEEHLENPSLIDRPALRQAHEQYWTKVEELQERTKGFWLPEDVAELERLKQERRQSIEHWSRP